MSERRKGLVNILCVLKCLLAGYVITGFSLILLAFGLYKFSLPEKVVDIAIIVIYILAAFFSGFLAGKSRKIKKFLWGAFMGSLYFVILFCVSFFMKQQDAVISSGMASVFVMCLGGGMLGGMLS